MKEPTFNIEAQSFFDAALKIQEGVLAGYRIEAEDVTCFPQQFGHFFFMKMLPAADSAATEVIETVETTIVASEEMAKAIARKRKPKADTETEATSEPVVQPAVEPTVETAEVTAEVATSDSPSE